MDFSESEDHVAIRARIQRLCPGFPDEYWARFIGRFSGWSRCIDAAKSYGG